MDARFDEDEDVISFDELEEEEDDGLEDEDDFEDEDDLDDWDDEDEDDLYLGEDDEV